ncbi:MAG: SUMF1/EgtB/PvdO family nonheme iron enzyme [Elainellaceae cyanobacterium]
MTDQQFDVFLAHSSKDKPLIRHVYRQLKARGIKPWLDEEEIAPGTSFQDEIQQAICQVKTAAIFLGQEGLGQWQVLELRTLITQCVERNISIIPVLLPGVDYIPKPLIFLREFQAVSFREKLSEEGICQLERGITKSKPIISEADRCPTRIDRVHYIYDELKDTLSASIQESLTTPILKTFGFQYIQLEPRKNLFPMFGKNYEVHKKRKRSSFFIEELGGGIELEMVSVPAGKLLSESSEEKTVVDSFFMSRCPVTQAQWKAVAHLQPINCDLPLSPSKFIGKDNPVERISWHESIEFCKRLLAKTGRNYRLPTELEWEFACRAETQSKFHFGEIIETEFANFLDDSSSSSTQGTTSVNRFEYPNALGLFDMHGNVYEWCLNHWTKKPMREADIERLIEKSDSHKSRIIRGGSWRDLSEGCRSSYRSKKNPDYKADFIGLRIVCIA